MDWWASTFPEGQKALKISDAEGQPVTVAYGETGQGPPLILVHGLGVWSYCWRKNVQVLAQHYRVICFDSVGSGFSEKPMRSAQVGHQVVELARVIEALCDQPAVLVSESLGALASLGVAIEYPGLIDRLVVINVPVFPEKLPSAVMRLLATVPQPAIYVIDYWRLLKRIQPISHGIARLAKREVITDYQEITRYTVSVAAYPYIELFGALTCFARDLKLALADIKRYLKGEACFTSRIHDRLGTIAHPTLVLWGEEDAWFPVEKGRKLQRQLPNAMLRVIPGCGHQAAASCPEEVNEAVLEFLGQGVSLDR